MARRGDSLLSLAAILIVASFLSGVAGWRFVPSGERIARTGTGEYYHGGKPAKGGVPDSRCQAKDCHGDYPHDQGPESAFRNMHVGFVECPVCHGREGNAAWKVEVGEENRWKIRTGTRWPAGDPHLSFGAPVRCRGCHSPQGRERIESGGTRKLQGTFNAPVALRMLEEGSRKWVPDGM